MKMKRFPVENGAELESHETNSLTHHDTSSHRTDEFHDEDLLELKRMRKEMKRRKEEEGSVCVDMSCKKNERGKKRGKKRREKRKKKDESEKSRKKKMNESYFLFHPQMGMCDEECIHLIQFDVSRYENDQCGDVSLQQERV